jgi:hypothetical protein
VRNFSCLPENGMSCVYGWRAVAPSLAFERHKGAVMMSCNDGNVEGNKWASRQLCSGFDGGLIGTYIDIQGP